MSLTIPTKPSLYFIGVTTGSSSIMKVFPKWSDILGLGADIVGYDAPLNAPSQAYERIVTHIKTHEQAKGALVTTHKLDLFNATKGEFGFLDDYATLCAEISCISKQKGVLYGHAKDPITSGLALQAFMPKNHWQNSNAELLCFGAGGAATAISLYLATLEHAPKSITIVDINAERLEHIESVHKKLSTATNFHYVLSANVASNDNLLASIAEQSLVINATGMGKDRPGSPLSAKAVFPKNSFVWELNYRGSLDFYHQAKAQEKEQDLHIEDGWIYFLHGWTQIIAEVFQIDLTQELFAELDKAASTMR